MEVENLSTTGETKVNAETTENIINKEIHLIIDLIINLIVTIKII